MENLPGMFFLRHGRIARGTWLFRMIALALVCTAFGMLAQSELGDRGSALFAALYVWCGSAVSIQRLHDIGRSGWSLLSLLIPVLGPLWLILQLFRRGVEGNNRYGSDPAARANYFQVNVAR